MLPAGGITDILQRCSSNVPEPGLQLELSVQKYYHIGQVKDAPARLE